MGDIHRIPSWRSTGTGRQVADTIEVEVAGGFIVGDRSSMSGSTLEVLNTTGVTLAAYALVYPTSWDETTGKWLIALADANAAGAQATHVLRDAILNNAPGLAYTAARSTATLATNGSVVGDPIYLSNAVGAWTATLPTGATTSVQIVGRVAIVDAAVGVIEFDLRDYPTAGTNDLQDLAVTEAKLGQNAVTGQKVSNDALGINSVAAVAVDHAAGSPVEILAANGAVDRVARVTLVATEAAAGGPDIDVGTTAAHESVGADIGAGVWPLGYRYSRVIRVPVAEAIIATINVAGTAGAFNAFVEIVTPVAQTANIADNAVQDQKLLALGTVRCLGGRDIGRTCAGYFYLTGVVADTQTVVVQGRTYEFDTNAAITGDVLVDVTADQTADAAITALVAAINADAARPADAVAWAGNSDVSAGCSFTTLAVGGVNVTLVETCVNGLVGATPAVGARNIADRDLIWGQYTITAQDVTTLALAGGNSVPIGGLPTTAAAILVGLTVHTAAGAMKSPATLVFTQQQANVNYLMLTVEDGAAVLADGDRINFALIV